MCWGRGAGSWLLGCGKRAQALSEILFSVNPRSQLSFRPELWDFASFFFPAGRKTSVKPLGPPPGYTTPQVHKLWVGATNF